MSQNKEPFIPINLLVLDGAGAILLGLGLLKHFGVMDVLPPPLRMEGYGLGLIIGGVILMLPALVHIIRKVSAQQPGRSPQ